MVGAREEDYDLIGIAEDELEASVQVFYVRKGRVVGRKGLDRRQGRRRRDAGAGRPRSSSSSTPTLAGDDIPKRDPRPGRARRLRALRGVPRAATAVRKVRIRVPQRGGKRELLETATLNARRERSARHKLRRASDHNARARGAGRAAGGARAARSAAAHRVLRHLEPAGHRDRRLDGRDGRRPAEAVRLPPVQGARRSTGRTTSRRWKRC